MIVGRWPAKLEVLQSSWFPEKFALGVGQSLVTSNFYSDSAVVDLFGFQYRRDNYSCIVGLSRRAFPFVWTRAWGTGKLLVRARTIYVRSRLCRSVRSPFPMYGVLLSWCIDYLGLSSKPRGCRWTCGLTSMTDYTAGSFRTLKSFYMKIYSNDSLCAAGEHFLICCCCCCCCFYHSCRCGYIYCCGWYHSYRRYCWWIAASSLVRFRGYRCCDGHSHEFCRLFLVLYCRGRRLFI